jgi:hypothetical protein
MIVTHAFKKMSLPCILPIDDFPLAAATKSFDEAVVDSGGGSDPFVVAGG